MTSIKSAARLYDMDWLRVTAVLLLLPFHTAMIFVTWNFHIKNDVLSPGLTAFNMFLNMWHMPLLFLLSGGGTFCALGFRSGKAYAVERLQRLGVPLLFGMLVVIPPQVYTERILKGQFHGSYMSFYPHVFSAPYPEGNLSWHHLWFMAYLLVYSLIVLPLFMRLRGRGAGTAEKFAAYFSKGGRIFILAIPLMLSELCLRPFYPGGNQNLIADWANFLYYIMYFIFGYMIYSDVRLREAAARNGKLALVIGAVIASTFLLLEFVIKPDVNSIALKLFAVVIWAFNGWCWVIGLCGVASRKLLFTNKSLKYAVDAALPFYIMHQTFIILIGARVIKLDQGIPVKFTVTLVLSFIVTMAAYEVVRRIGVLRFLMGMRKMKRA